MDGDPVVGRTSKLFLRGTGYNVQSLEYPFEGDLGAPLGVARLLLPRAPTPEAREALGGDIKAILALSSLPTVALMSVLDEVPQSDGLAAYASWPCRIEELVRHIEAALLHHH